MKNISWQVMAIAFAVLIGSGIVGLVGVVWAQGSELATQKERVEGMRGDIADMRASIEKKIDKLDDKLGKHMELK
jgi:hypothetical protein